MNTITLFDGTDVLAPMTESEARACADRIRVGIVNVERDALDLYEREGWRALGYSSWRACALAEFPFKQSHLYRLLDAAIIECNISPLGESIDVEGIPETHLRPLKPLPPEAQRTVWQQAVESAPNGKVTAAHVQSVVNEYRQPVTLRTCPRCGKQWAADLENCPYCNQTDDARIEAMRKPLPLVAANHAVSDNPDYDGDEWYTPATYIEAARSVMGAIDLDPATSAAAQEVVKAATWYTKQDDGLSVPWEGRVWINPPYSMPLIRQFTSKLIDEYENGNVTQAIILTNNSSDTAWFHDLLSHYPACFTRGRVQFWRPDHDAFGARQGQVLFYLGDNIEAFTHVFCAFGQVVQRI